MSQTTKGRLGDRLIAKGLLTHDQLEVALNEQKRAHRPLGVILISLGFVGPDSLADLIAEDLGLVRVRARDVVPDELLLSALDPEFVHETQAFPLRMENGSLVVAMVDPGDPEKVSAVRQRFPFPLELLVLTEDDLNSLVRQHLRAAQGELATIFQTTQGANRRFGDDFPVERVTEALMIDGIRRGATDVHLEPEENITRVRYRVDGILQQGENLPRDATEAVLSRIKVLARLDIAERRRPQDGRMRLTVDGRRVDLRVSLLPCTHGENAVLRILDTSANTLRLAQLGVPAAVQGRLRAIASRPHGLFLVTGPTGSGKTTTLYAILAEVDALRRNVATIEDPVEYSMPLIRQSQVDASIGFDFNTGLRSLLRQDPDVLLVGEIRDAETAGMAIKASMTGHLVLSTLHTNTAIGAIPRLSDLGVEPFLVEDALIGVLGQRLVRRVCEGCAEPAILDEREVAWLDGDVGAPRRGSGCSQCGQSGLYGRTMIQELFLPEDELAESIRQGKDMGHLLRAALERGFRPMLEDGKDKVRQGLTTPAEVLRVARGHRLGLDER